MDNEFLKAMYKKICKKLLIYKYLFLLLRVVLLINCFLILLFIVWKLFVNFNISHNTTNEYINIELIEKPILQINNEHNDLIYITSSDAIVKNSYNDIILNNVSISSDFVNGLSKTIIFNGNTDEILMKDRPELIFYNIIEDN